MKERTAEVMQSALATGPTSPKVPYMSLAYPTEVRQSVLGAAPPPTGDGEGQGRRPRGKGNKGSSEGAGMRAVGHHLAGNHAADDGHTGRLPVRGLGDDPQRRRRDARGLGWPAEVGHVRHAAIAWAVALPAHWPARQPFDHSMRRRSPPHGCRSSHRQVRYHRGHGPLSRPRDPGSARSPSGQSRSRPKIPHDDCLDSRAAGPAARTTTAWAVEQPAP